MEEAAFAGFEDAGVEFDQEWQQDPLPELSALERQAEPKPPMNETAPAAPAKAETKPRRPSRGLPVKLSRYFWQDEEGFIDMEGRRVRRGWLQEWRGRPAWASGVLPMPMPAPEMRREEGELEPIASPSPIRLISCYTAERGRNGTDAADRDYVWFMPECNAKGARILEAWP